MIDTDDIIAALSGEFGRIEVERRTALAITERIEVERQAPSLAQRKVRDRAPAPVQSSWWQRFLAVLGWRSNRA